MNVAPGQVGSSKEASIRKKLQQILPEGIGVGSGFVIDSYGHTSKQIDLVLYEKDICPVYQINDDPASSFYPCEGVFAVGEVKSSLDSAGLVDMFEKIESVKRLRRFSRQYRSTISGKSHIPFRNYGSTLSVDSAGRDNFCQSRNLTDQIFGFGFAGGLRISRETFCEKFTEFAKKIGCCLRPNLIVTLNDGLILPSVPLLDNKEYIYAKGGNGFRFLISQLYSAYRQGRTVDRFAFQQYFSLEDAHFGLVEKRFQL